MYITANFVGLDLSSLYFWMARCSAAGWTVGTRVRVYGQGHRHMTDQRWRVLLVLSEWTTPPSPILDRARSPNRSMPVKSWRT